MGKCDFACFAEGWFHMVIILMVTQCAELALVQFGRLVASCRLVLLPGYHCLKCGRHMMNLDGDAVRRFYHMMFPAGLVPWSWAFRDHRWDEVRGW